MFSITSLYGLFALTSLVLFNCLLLLARYVQQTKRPPEDADFESLKKQQTELQSQLVHKENEMLELQSRLNLMEQDLKRLQAAPAAASPASS